MKLTAQWVNWTRTICYTRRRQNVPITVAMLYQGWDTGKGNVI